MSTKDKQLLFKQPIKFDIPEVEEKQDSEIPPELKFQINDVLSVLREVIEKLKISFILPKILENPRVLQQYFQNTKYSPCLDLVKKYRKIRKFEPPKQPNQNDYETVKLIDYFQENHQMLSVLPNWLDDIDKKEKYLLKACQDVYQIAEQRFHRTAVSVLAKEKRLHAIYWANEKTVQKINEMNQKIDHRKINLLWKHAARSGVLQQLEDELAFSQYDNNLFVKREMIKSQREIQRANNAFVAKQQELEEELRKARLNYETKLKQDMKQEKIIQDERNKIQLQLQALIKKYDQTIYDKHVEEMFLQKEYEKQKQVFDQFYVGYQKEEDKYEELVTRRQQALESKAMLIAYTRAAIKIQKWWKKIKKRMAKEAKRIAREERKNKKKK